MRVAPPPCEHSQQVQQGVPEDARCESQRHTLCSFRVQVQLLMTLHLQRLLRLLRDDLPVDERVLDARVLLDQVVLAELEIEILGYTVKSMARQSNQRLHSQ